MPRTLLSINNYHYARAGAEVVYLNEMELFRTKGWSVVPFAMRHAKNIPDPNDRFFVDEIELGSHYSAIEALGKIPKVVYSVEARDKLRDLLTFHKPDVCHIHNIYHHISPSILSLLRQRGIPTVLTMHDLKLACPAYKMLATDGICERCKGGKHRNLLRQRCIKGSLALSALVYVETKVHSWLRSYVDNVDRFIAPSRFFYRKMTEWGINPSRMRYIPNSIPLSTYSPPSDAGTIFTYIGRLAPEKGLGTLIRAAARARVRLRIVGTGPEEESLRTLASAQASDVEFTGFLQGEALRSALRNSRALVLPSEWYENAPISVLEAYREGVPVIGAAIGGIPEMVEEGTTGFTFVSGAVESLTERLEQCASIPDSLIRMMGDAGRRLVELEYGEELYFDRLIQLYADIDAESSARSNRCS